MTLKLQNKWKKYRTAAVRYFFIDTYFKVFWYSRTEQPMYFLKT